MRQVRRLPPLLRAVRIVGWAFAPAIFGLLIASFVTRASSAPHAWLDSSRLSILAANVAWLGLACNVVCVAYRTRGGRPHLGPFPLDSWRSQVRTILLLWALPLCGIVSALAIAPTSPAFLIVALLFTVLADLVLIAALVGIRGGRAGAGRMSPPPTG